MYSLAASGLMFEMTGGLTPVILNSCPSAAVITSFPSRFPGASAFAGPSITSGVIVTYAATFPSTVRMTGAAPSI